ncbi:MAG: UvrD-helicase domain-containing protein [Alkalispirochaeta sp.]
MSTITLVSAGAGSGKTYDITTRIVEMLTGTGMRPAARPEEVIATTFTHRAADELGLRIRARLQESGNGVRADRTSAMYVGTVHSVAGRLLRDYTYELGLSPDLEVVPEEDSQQFIDESLSLVLAPKEAAEIDRLAIQFGLQDRQTREATWPRWVKRIVAAARTNAIEPEGLVEHATFSWDSLSPCLPSPQPNDDLVDTVRQELERVLARDLTRADTTKATAGTLTRLTAIAARLGSGTGIGWDDWETMRTVETKVGAKSREEVAPLAAAAEGYAALPSFQNGLRRLIEMVYDLARRLIEVYQDYKRERGLVDFVDQEAMLLTALHHPEIAASVAARFRVLVVDEFQDTSPIQLAIFMRLSELVERVVWVGDPKQSIYGFRDADPKLMEAATEHIGTEDAVLDRSYRSRPDLVYFANALFTGAFRNTPPEKVRLTPVREEESELPRALRLFSIIPAQTKGRVTKAHLIEGLVRLVRRSLDFRHAVVDRVSNKRRELHPGDIAILVRTNDTVREIAARLQAAGIPVAAERDGLTDTLEYHLITAALRYVTQPDDTLAEAELRLLLADEPDPQELLQERLSARAEQTSHGTVSLGAATGWLSRPVELDSLDRLRREAAGMSVYRLTDEIITGINVHRVVMRFGSHQSRRANIDLIRSRVSVYDQWCARFARVPQVSGFLQWISERERREERDRQAAAVGDGAVNVLTYHRAKGLEWPLVIAWDLDHAPKVSAFGLTVDQTVPFDTTAPLAGRMLRWWPRSNAGILDELVAGSPHAGEAERRAHEESRRLLYVGLTRARDYLFLPIGPGTKKDPGSRVAWLNDALGEEFPVPDTTANTTIAVNGATIRTEVQQIRLDEEDPSCLPDPEPPRWYDPVPGRGLFPPQVINPSLAPVAAVAAVAADGEEGASAASSVPFRIARRLSVGAPVELSGESDARAVGDAYHQLASILIRRGELEQRVVNTVLAAHGVDDPACRKLVMSRLPETLQLVRRTWGGGVMLAEVPVQVPFGDQYITGTIDLLMERGYGTVLVVDHKVHAQSSADLDELVGRYTSQLWWYRRALALGQVDADPVLCLSFPVQGIVCEVEIGELQLTQRSGFQHI